MVGQSRTIHPEPAAETSKKPLGDDVLKSGCGSSKSTTGPQVDPAASCGREQRRSSFKPSDLREYPPGTTPLRRWRLANHADEESAQSTLAEFIRLSRDVPSVGFSMMTTNLVAVLQGAVLSLGAILGSVIDPAGVEGSPRWHNITITITIQQYPDSPAH
eukprot:5545240-Prymnesium_polylepis.1